MGSFGGGAAAGELAFEFWNCGLDFFNGSAYDEGGRAKHFTIAFREKNKAGVGAELV